jgi:hypothetical protein
VLVTPPARVTTDPPSLAATSSASRETGSSGTYVNVRGEPIS